MQRPHNDILNTWDSWYDCLDSIYPENNTVLPETHKETPLSLASKTQDVAAETLSPSVENFPRLSNVERRFEIINQKDPFCFMSTEQLQEHFPHALGTSALRNRYTDNLPTTVDIVTLKQRTNPQTSYINANAYKNMIVTQGPLKDQFSDTLTDFWMLAFEQGGDIVCLTDHQEGDVEKTFPYWMSQNREIAESNSVIYKKKIELEGQKDIDLVVCLAEGPWTAIESNENGEKITKRVFKIVLNGNAKYVNHWHFENWKDRNRCDPRQLARLIELVAPRAITGGASSITPLAQNDATIVHCSAGLGRSGVFAVTKHFLDCYRNNRVIPTDEEIDNEVIELRKRRPGSVQSTEQLDLIRKTIQTYTEANIANRDREETSVLKG